VSQSSWVWTIGFAWINAHKHRANFFAYGGHDSIEFSKPGGPGHISKRISGIWAKVISES